MCKYPFITVVARSLVVCALLPFAPTLAATVSMTNFLDGDSAYGGQVS